MDSVHVLVVEDDAGWRQVLTSILEKQGYSVETAANYDDARTALAQSRLQLVLMDLRLVDDDESNLDGIRLLSLIRVFNPCARAIVFTAFAAHEREAYQASFGVHSYLLKMDYEEPVFLRTVRDAIQEAIDCEKGLRPKPAYPDLI